MSDEQKDTPENKKVVVSSSEIGSKKTRALTPDELRKALVIRTDDKSKEKGSDELLDRFTERINLVTDNTNRDIVSSDRPSDYKPRIEVPYYAHLFRLLGLKVTDEKFRRKPMILAAITLRLIYLRFPYGTVKKLRKANPKVNGKRLFKHFQVLTAIGDIGFYQFLEDANKLMAVCTYYDEFIRKFSQQYGKTWQMPLFDKD
jgi:hypothetical protein